MSTINYSVQDAIIWGELVKSAYSTYDADKKNDNPPEARDLPAGWRVTANLQSDPAACFFTETEFIGFVVQAETDASRYGIVFRGTESVMDWLEDFEARHTAFDEIDNGGRTEGGFTEMFRSLHVLAPGAAETRTFPAFMETLPPDARLTITGHSLGGAIANLTAVWIAAKHPTLTCDLYTFAAPMTGNRDFADTFNSLVRNSFRIYNKPDIVPTVPLHLLGYEQVNTGIEVNSLDVPTLPRNIGGYHSLDTYLFLLRQQAE